jgi:phosphoenolpyruvate synthase/pyruvate phosphate dikinase
MHKILLVKCLKQKKQTFKLIEIKGIVGCPGIYKGKVTIVNNIHDRVKFKCGDVMVTHDGSAELTVFLKEAGAIITNEGGMICHASIIAREMKTPCIVGTKIATMVLKDGDLVEVDADKGVVRKI